MAAALVTLPVGAARAAAALSPVGAVFQDGRHELSRRFAALLPGGGANALDTRSGLLELWHGEHGVHRLPAKQTLIAGLTTYSDFIVLRSLARDLRLDLVYQIAIEPRRSWCRVDRLDALTSGADLVHVFDLIRYEAASTRGPSSASLTAFLLGLARAS